MKKLADISFFENLDSEPKHKVFNAGKDAALKKAKGVGRWGWLNGRECQNGAAKSVGSVNKWHKDGVKPLGVK